MFEQTLKIGFVAGHVNHKAGKTNRPIGGRQTKQWTTSGMIRFAVKGVGRPTALRKGVGGSTRGLMATVSLAEMALQIQAEKLTERFRDVEAGFAPWSIAIP
jgi:hypothetical protein